jgi:hypothetical protein
MNLCLFYRGYLTCMTFTHGTQKKHATLTNEICFREATTVDRNEVRMAFEETIVITAHGYDKTFIEEFEDRFAKTTGIITR